MDERTTDRSTVTAVFKDSNEAQQAIEAVRMMGLRDDQIDFASYHESAMAGQYVSGEEPRFYGLQSGAAVVTVRPEGRHQEVSDLFHRAGAIEVTGSKMEQLGASGSGGDRDLDESGDRTTIQGSTGSSYDASRGGRIDETTPDRITQTNTYNIGITGEGDVRTGSSTGAPRPDSPESAPHWDDVSNSYRNRWDKQHGSQGRRWENYEPGYRYGWERANMAENRGRSWSEVEPDLRSRWEAEHHDSPWDRIVDSVRDAWDSVAGGSGQDRDRAA